MPLYRFECIDHTNKPVWRETIDCTDDLDALDKAQLLGCTDDVDIWQGMRRVARVPKRKAKLPPFTRVSDTRAQPESVIPLRWRTQRPDK
jgi:hypothetical protein